MIICNKYKSKYLFIVTWIHVSSTMKLSPINKRVTRSMVKEKDTEVRKETSPIVLDDSPKKASPEPSLDSFGTLKFSTQRTI